jgi:hypothetical protein
MWQFLHIFLNRQEFFRELIFLAGVGFACLVPRFADRPFSSIEGFGARLAQRKLAAVFWIFVATILLRLSLLWLIPVPHPLAHDEFSYLLAGDTFVHGRLTNPTHPMWLYFDTFHVNQQPTYMSKYPPAQGAVLAFGQLLGNPWIGVLLSVGAMCGAVVWMLQGWLPPKWALLGGVLAMFRVAIFSYWTNSYFGAAVSAIGGALVAGALPRILRTWRARDAVLLGAGTVILANSRPYEGAFFCLPVFFVVLVGLYRHNSPSWRITVPQIVVPLCVIAILGGAFMAYYNWRATGSVTLSPYAVNEKTYMSAPTFSWQKLGPPRHYANPQFEGYYNGIMRQYWLQRGVTNWQRAVEKAEYISVVLFFFYLCPPLAITVLTSFRILRDRRVRFLLLQIGLVFFSFLLVRARFNPHYTAPLLGGVFAVVTQGMRHIRRWEYWGRPIGIGITRVVVLGTALLAPFNSLVRTRFEKPDVMQARLDFTHQLDVLPGQHLVIVRYSPLHGLPEWVYNGADIDSSKIVWARDIPGVSLQPLLDYFQGRQVWLAEPDNSPPRLSRYESASVMRSQDGPATHEATKSN